MKLGLSKFKEHTTSANYTSPENKGSNYLKQSVSFDTDPIKSSKYNMLVDRINRHNYRYKILIHNTLNLNENEYQEFEQFMNVEIPSLFPQLSITSPKTSNQNTKYSANESKSKSVDKKINFISPFKLKKLEENSLFTSFDKINPSNTNQISLKPLSNKTKKFLLEKEEIGKKKLHELKEKLFNKKSEIIDQSDESDKEQQQISKIDKMINRTMFKFEINSCNNNFKLKRLRSKTYYNEEIKRRQHIRKTEKILSPLIQKQNFEVTDKRRNSIKVLINPKNVIKQQQIGSLIRIKEFKEFFSKSKERELPAIIERIKKSLNQRKYEFLFDLSTFSIDKLDQTDFFVLYFALNRALQPSFYGVKEKAINLLENEMLGFVKNSRILSNYDLETIKKFNEYIKLSQDGQIYTGFWISKKEESDVPASREGASMVSDKDIVFLFGGFSNAPLNDLWALKLVENTSIHWTHIQSSPDMLPRYGHCMAYFKQKIYILFVAGETLKGIKAKLVFNDVWEYNFKGNIWINLKPRGNIPERRANCAYCLIDNIMFIHGGNQGNRRLFYNDIIAYNIDKNLFCEIYSNNKYGIDYIEKMAWHCAIGVLPTEVKEKNEKLDYWTCFHKWKHVDSCQIPVNLN